MSKKNLNDMHSILSTINSLDSKAKKTQKLNENIAESDYNEEGKCPSCGCEECECSEMDEGNAFTGKLAHTKHGEKFELGGRTYKDTSKLEEDKEFCEGYYQLIDALVNRVADSLNASLSNKRVDTLIREATEVVVYDWCEFDYDKDTEWLELIADIKAGSKHGQDLVDAVESQMNFMGTLDKVDEISRGGSLEEGTCTECGMYEDMCECGSGMYEDDLYENCSVGSYSNTEQDNLSINTSYSTRDNRKYVTISAEGEQAEALLQMLKLAGLTHTDHAQRAQALVIAQEAKDYGNTEVDEPEEHSNTPRPKHADVDMIKKMGADLNRPKKQFADKPKAGDNPMATNENIDPLKTLGRDLMKMYKGIQK
jgi:hypothetical protein